jgi:hypothetical protein
MNDPRDNRFLVFLFRLSALLMLLLGILYALVTALSIPGPGFTKGEAVLLVMSIAALITSVAWFAWLSRSQARWVRAVLPAGLFIVGASTLYGGVTGWRDLSWKLRVGYPELLMGFHEFMDTAFLLLAFLCFYGLWRLLRTSRL